VDVVGSLDFHIFFVVVVVAMFRGGAHGGCVNRLGRRRWWCIELRWWRRGIMDYRGRRRRRDGLRRWRRWRSCIVVSVHVRHFFWRRVRLEI
jgi:hypothetical protein